MYDAARRLNIIDELVDRKYHQWTKEEIKELANECKYRSDFEAKYPKAYKAAWKRGWLKDICKDMPEYKSNTDIHTNNYLVYVYEETKTHSAYVGLTNNINRRHFQHQHSKNGKYDSLGQFCIDNNVTFPKYKILKENLSSTAAREYEFKYYFKYKDAGWNMINSEKTLGYLGHGNTKWSKDNILKIIAEHPEINSRYKLQQSYPGAYHSALRYGIIDELFDLKY